MSKKKVTTKKTSPHLKESQNNLFIMILSCAALILGSSYFLISQNNQPQAKIIVEEKNSITVESQVPGNKVTISKVVLDKPGFVIIRLSDGSGEVGKVIGVSKYLADDTDVLNITLYEYVKSAQKLTAEIRSDDDTNKRFNVQKDLEVKDSTGNKVLAPFQVQ